jgi:iron(III) transport system permease protein
MYTAIVCGLCVALALPIGSLLSILLVRTNVYGRSLGWIVLGSQLAVPLYAFAGSWSAGFGWQGWIANPASWLGGSAVAAMQSTWASVLAVSALHALAAVPWVALIVALGLYWSQHSLEEMAILEQGWCSAIAKVIVPQLRPWFIVGAAWCCLPIMTEMVITNLYQVPTIAEQIYFDASRGTITIWTYAASALLYSLTLAFLFLFVFVPSLRRSAVSGTRSRQRMASLAHQQTLRLGGHRLLITLLTWCILLFLVGLPIVNLIAKSGWQPVHDIAGKVSYGWSFVRFGTTIQETATLFLTEFRWSVVLAIGSTLLALTIGSLLASLTGSITRHLVPALMLALICTPGPLVGIMLIWLFNREAPVFLGQLYDRTLLAPILAQQFRLLPIAWLLVRTIVHSTPAPVWELARIDGLTRHQKLFLVVGRHNWMRWMAVSVALMSFSIGELSCSILVLPPGVTTLAMRLFEMLHFGMRHQDSGLCGLLVLVGWFVSLVVWKTLRER